MICPEAITTIVSLKLFLIQLEDSLLLNWNLLILTFLFIFDLCNFFASNDKLKIYLEIGTNYKCKIFSTLKLSTFRRVLSDIIWPKLVDTMNEYENFVYEHKNQY